MGNSGSDKEPYTNPFLPPPKRKQQKSGGDWKKWEEDDGRGRETKVPKSWLLRPECPLILFLGRERGSPQTSQGL